MHPGHIQLTELGEDLLGHLLCLLLPVFAQCQGSVPGGFFLFSQLLFQLLYPVIGKLDIIQLLLGFIQIRQDLLTVRAVFPAEPMDDIQP